ncbi:MAG TPA: EamA family transporter [Gemmatimonadales bacterium]
MSKQVSLAAIAYGTVCLVWGSTYLAIRIGVQEMPPMPFAACRFLIAGTLMLIVARLRGRPLPARRSEWLTSIVAGVLLLGAAGLVVWAEQYVASGVAAIIIGTVSLWMVLFDALIPGSRAQPTWSQGAGLLLGFLGTLLLVGTDLDELRHADWRGPIALTLASGIWALGSIWQQRRPPAGGPYVSAAVQMLAGGTALLVVGMIRGEWSQMSFSWRGVSALAYLIVFGSMIAFTAYVYMLQHWPAAMAGTYVYVNTIVAVLLGWLILAEPITGRTVLSMAVVLVAVTWVKRGAPRTAEARPASRVPVPQARMTRPSALRLL